MPIPVLTLQFDDIRNAKVVSHEKNTSIILVGETFPLCVTYGKSSLTLRSLGLMIGTLSDGGAFKSKGKILAQLPARQNQWHTDPLARLTQLALLLKTHQERSERLQTLLTQAIGEMELPQRPYYWIRHQNNTLNLYLTKQNIPYGTQFYQIAQHTFCILKERFRPFLNSRICIISTTQKSSAHERLELEQNVHSLLHSTLQHPTTF